ncbi:hypothetical protein [Pseudomonas glycinae]|uniref:hypothetical protein n=1 Tax=Pseudomonas glycinae TaxID=1785145 RepID=UPI00167E48E4|nr:hypothetical protein [Pseudomonas glycinae]
MSNKCVAASTQVVKLPKPATDGLQQIADYVDSQPGMQFDGDHCGHGNADDLWLRLTVPCRPLTSRQQQPPIQANISKDTEGQADATPDLQAGSRAEGERGLSFVDSLVKDADSLLKDVAACTQVDKLDGGKDWYAGDRHR